MKRTGIFLIALLMTFFTFLSPQVYAEQHLGAELEKAIPGFTLLEQPEEPIKVKRIEITQVLSSDCKVALAYASTKKQIIQYLMVYRF